MNGATFFNRKKQEIGVSLNDIQKKAVLHTEGALLLLASPGSGKTTTIIMRIGYLIEEKNVDPTRIKAVTFSKASAIDMLDRYHRFFPTLPPVDFSTIHSLAFEIVRDYFLKNRVSYEIIEGSANAKVQGSQRQMAWSQPPLQKKLLLRHLYKTIVGDNITEDQLEELTTYISFIKNKLLTKEEWSTVVCDVPEAERIFQEYEEFKGAEYHKLLLDFDDMLTIAKDALEKDRGLLRKYQQRYDYVLTDESQDTSMVQHVIIEKLVEEHGNLCVVADDDQSIYTWRAAEPQYLLNFKEVYPRAEVLMMEQNYRSSKDIVDVANQFIKRNEHRYDKNMFTENIAHEPIRIRTLPDYKFQAKYLVDKVSRGANYQNTAILYRNNTSAIILMNDFDRAGIPFYMKDSDIRFFSHWVVEDVLNFMRMTFSDKRPDILEKIFTKFNGYITRRQMDTLKGIRNDISVFDNLLKNVELKDYQVKHIHESKATFKKMQGKAPLEVIQTIRQKLGYEKALEKMSESLGFRLENLTGILNTLEEIADTLETMEDFAKRLTYLETLLKNSKFNKGKNAVTFSTFHSAKGLEFNQVFMIDLVEGIFPSKDDVDEFVKGNVGGMEESVRLFYVGMTRAERHLELLSYRKRDKMDVKESEFVGNVRDIISPPKEIEVFTPKKNRRSAVNVAPNPNALKDLAPFGVGDKVKHRKFGVGEILRLDGEMIEIGFEKAIKKFFVKTCLESGLLEAVENN